MPQETLQILTHVYCTDNSARLYSIQQSLDLLLDAMGKPSIKANDPTVINSLLRDCGYSFWDSCSYATSVSKNYTDLNFYDLMLIVGLTFYNFPNNEYTKNILTTYFSRKYGNNYSSLLPFPEITEASYGLLLYREQADELAVKVTGMSHKQARQLGSKLRMCLMEAWNYKTAFKSLGKKRGLSDSELDIAWNEFATKAKYHIDQKFTMAVSWLAYQLEYLKVHHSKQFSDFIEDFNHKNINFDSYLKSIQTNNTLNFRYTL